MEQVKKRIPPAAKPGQGLSPKAKKVLGVSALVVFVAFSAAAMWFIGRPMIQYLSRPDAFRAWVDQHGLLGRLAFIGMMALQVVVALIPGEVMEIGAGYAFGFWEGTLLCLLGAMLGSAIVFGFVRRFGVALVEVFFPIEKIRSLRFLRDSRRLNLLVFIIFFIPGTPKDLLAYAVGLTPMKFGMWMFITGVARIPSVITSTIGGSALGEQNYWFAGMVFAATLLLSGAGLLVYRHISKKHVEN